MASCDCGREIDNEAYYADRAALLVAVTESLVNLDMTATDEERERILDYLQATRHATWHAIAAVLGGPCHCAPCRKGEPSGRFHGAPQVGVA